MVKTCGHEYDLACIIRDPVQCQYNQGSSTEHSANHILMLTTLWLVIELQDSYNLELGAQLW